MSAHKVSLIGLVASLIMLAIGLIVLCAPPAVVAQCEDPQPSCCACHATAHPVTTEGEWHAIHARKECCRACHGGNDRADDKEAAHVGMTLHPLQDTYLACHQCHPDDYQQRAEVFAVALHMTPQSSEPTAHPAVAASTPPPMIVTPLPRSAEQAAPVWEWPVLLALVLLAIGGVVLWWKRAHSN
jgi:hypothetical protein